MKVVENWKPVVGYEGLYEVSDLGRVRSLNYHRTGEMKVMTPRKDGGGYLYVPLFKNKVRHVGKVHRLVAFAFVEGHDLFKNDVNHLNEDKTDNRAVNLEWCDRKYNLNYGTHNERMIKTLSTPIVQLTLDYKFITKWPSSCEAGRQCGLDDSKISRCCKHKKYYNTAGGYRWFYLTEYEEICFKAITSQHPFHLALPYRA